METGQGERKNLAHSFLFPSDKSEMNVKHIVWEEINHLFDIVRLKTIKAGWGVHWLECGDKDNEDMVTDLN